MLTRQRIPRDQLWLPVLILAVVFILGVLVGRTTIPSSGSSTFGTTTSPTRLSAAGGYRNVVLGEPSLMSYWRLGETSGTSVRDTKGARNGVYVNGVTLGAPGAIVNDPDTAVTLNGSTGKVGLPPLPSVTDFSIEAWTYLGPGAPVNSNGNNALYGTKGNVRLLVRPGSGYTSTAAYASVWLNGTEFVLQPASGQSNLDVWVQWVLTRSAGTLSLYRNGVPIDQRSDLPATATANISGSIGAQSGSTYFLHGSVDEVSVYDNALSPNAVANHYNAVLVRR